MVEALTELGDSKKELDLGQGDHNLLFRSYSELTASLVFKGNTQQAMEIMLLNIKEESRSHGR